MADTTNLTALQRENEQLQRRNRALTAVAEVSRKLAQTLDLHEICRVIYREIAHRLWQVPHLTIALFDDTTAQISAAFLIVDGEEADASQLPMMKLGAGPISDTIRSREIQKIDFEVTLDNLKQQGRAVIVGDARQPAVALYVPMVSTDRVVGVLGMQHYDPQAFADLDTDMLYTMAAQAGAALIHANLFQRTQQSEEKYRELVETLPSGVVVTENGRITFVNRTFNTMLGYQPGDLIGKDTARLLPTEIAATPSRQQQKGGLIGEQEMRLQRPDGRFVWHAIKTTPFRNSSGQISGTLSIHTDITARKQAEAALLETESFMRSVMTSVQQGIMVCDRTMRVRYWNPYMEALTGLKVSEVLARPLHTICPYMSTQPPEAIQATILSGNAIPPFEMAYDFGPQGRNGWLIITHSPLLNAQGDIHGMVAVLNDITEKKQTEDILRQTQKLESLGVMAGGIAHDFNNLLVALLAQTDLAEAKLATDNPARDHIAKAAQAARRAAAVTRQLLTYAGQDIPDLQPLNLNDLIQQNMPLLDVAISRQVSMETNLMPNLPTIEANPGQMQQVVMNLVLNAAEAIGDQSGKVTVRTQRIADTAVIPTTGWQQGITQPLTGPLVLLEITDTGSGMSPDILERIFDPFFSTKFTGRGLGLAAVLGIVRSHNGTITVDSSPGKGTTFRLLFPVMEVQFSSKMEEDIVQTPQPLTPYKLLIIDDDVAVCEAVTDILAMEGMGVLTALNGADGIKTYQQHGDQIDLVLLDFSMPGMSGSETLAALRALDANVRVILSTGYAESRMQAFLTRGEVVGLLPKPFDFDGLVQTVRNHLPPR